MKTKVLTRTGFTIVVGLFLAAAWPSTAAADVFELEDGRKIEGTVVRESGSLISVKTTSGKIETFDVAQIKRRRATETKYDDYLARRKKVESVEKPTTRDHLELALWCLDQKLDKESIFHFKQVLKLDPNHPEARDALGFERVKGDWYLKGPEAEAAKRGEKTGSSPVREVPDDYDPKALKRKITEGSKEPAKHDPSRPPVSGDVMRYIVNEKVGGEKPAISASTHLIQQFVSGLDDPLTLASGDGEGEFVMKLKIDVKFERTQMFYKRVPLYHIFQGVAEVRIYEKGKEKSPIIHMPKVTCQFSASVQLDKKEAIFYAYHDTVNTVIARLSKRDFFKARGAEPRKSPEEGG